MKAVRGSTYKNQETELVKWDLEVKANRVFWRILYYSVLLEQMFDRK